MRVAAVRSPSPVVTLATSCGCQGRAAPRSANASGEDRRRRRPARSGTRMLQTMGGPMQVSKRTWLSFAAMLAVALAAGIGGFVPRAQAQQPIKIGIEHRPDRRAGRRRQGGAGRAADVGRGRQRARRAARPQGGAHRLRRPVEPGDHARHLREAARHRQGRPARSRPTAPCPPRRSCRS